MIERAEDKERRAWRRTATLMAHEAILHVGGKWEADDFDPYRDVEEVIKSPVELLAIVEQLNEKFGGRDLRSPEKKLRGRLQN